MWRKENPEDVRAEDPIPVEAAAGVTLNSNLTLSKGYNDAEMQYAIMLYSVGSICNFNISKDTLFANILKKANPNQVIKVNTSSTIVRHMEKAY